MIKLTKPFSPGDNAPGKTYPHAQITMVAINLAASVMRVEYEIGEEVVDPVSGAKLWHRGPGTSPQAVTISGDDYKALVIRKANADEIVYDGAKRLLYQYLLDQNAVAGTIA